MFSLIYHQYTSLERRFILVLLICCLTLYIGRIQFSGTLHYFFMIWNLFLGFIPLMFSRLVREGIIQNKSRWIIPIYSLLWLLFFPNSYYMLTDLYHFNIRPGMPQWYDLLFLLTFAWSGIMMGMMSLWDIETALIHRNREKWVPYVSTFLLCLAGFGIYLGRDLRWNSWDIFINFFHVISDSLDLFFHPIQNQDAWGLIIFMAVFLNIIHWSFRIKVLSDALREPQ